MLFKRPDVRVRGAYVLHRILRRMPDHRFWIAGDNCTEGEVVAEDCILGVMVAVARKEGKQLKVTDLRYRLYVLLWCRPWRIRFLALRVVRFVRRVFGCFKRRVRRGGGAA